MIPQEKLWKINTIFIYLHHVGNLRYSPVLNLFGYPRRINGETPLSFVQASTCCRFCILGKASKPNALDPWCSRCFSCWIKGWCTMVQPMLRGCNYWKTYSIQHNSAIQTIQTIQTLELPTFFLKKVNLSHKWTQKNARKNIGANEHHFTNLYKVRPSMWPP